MHQPTITRPPQGGRGASSLPQTPLPPAPTRPGLASRLLACCRPAAQTPPQVQAVLPPLGRPQQAASATGAAPAAASAAAAAPRRLAAVAPAPFLPLLPASPSQALASSTGRAADLVLPRPTAQDAPHQVAEAFGRRDYKRAAQHFVLAALGPQAQPRDCRALLLWLDQACAAWSGQVRGMRDSLRELMQAIGEAGSQLLAQSASRHALDRPLMLLAAAYEQRGFPRLPELAQGEAGSGTVLAHWLGGLLLGLPLVRYPEGTGTTWDRPSHAHLVALLDPLGPESLPHALLQDWASSLSKPSVDSPGAVLRLLIRLLREEAQRGRDPAALAALARSFMVGTDQDRLAHFAPTPLYAQDWQALIQSARQACPEKLRGRLGELLQVPAGQLIGQPRPPIPRPSTQAPLRAYTGPGTEAEKQNRVSAWFGESISRLSREEFVQAREALFAELQRRAQAVMEPDPMQPGAALPGAALPMDEEVASDALLETHPALPMFYASYTNALQPLLRLGRALAANQVPGEDGSLARALVWARLGRHASGVAAEQAWLASWAGAGHVKVLGHEPAAHALRQLRHALDEVVSALVRWRREAPGAGSGPVVAASASASASTSAAAASVASGPSSLTR